MRIKQIKIATICKKSMKSNGGCDLLTKNTRWPEVLHRGHDIMTILKMRNVRTKVSANMRDTGCEATRGLAGFALLLILHLILGFSINLYSFDLFIYF